MGFYLNKLILYTVNFTKPLLTMDENDIKACGDNKCDSKLLRSNLAPWKEFVVLASKLSKWEQPFYPVIIFALVSIKFLFVWYMDPSFVTGISFFLLFVFVLDYAIPFISPMVFPPAGWNSSKEKEFSSACKGLANAQNSVKSLLAYLQNLKHGNPWLYVAILSVSLSTLAWIGNQMHNLMLLYFFVLLVTFLPGLKHHGLLSLAQPLQRRFSARSLTKDFKKLAFGDWEFL